MEELPIILRSATINDLALLLHWDEQPHVLACDPDHDWDWRSELLYEPAWREQLVAEMQGRPIGFVQIIDPALEESHYWGDVPSGLRAIDIWIGEATDLNRGYGAIMMQMAIQRCFAEPSVSVILIDPLVTNTAAHRFYQRLGFEPKYEKYFDEDHCLVMELRREQWAIL